MGYKKTGVTEHNTRYVKRLGDVENLENSPQALSRARGSAYSLILLARTKIMSKDKESGSIRPPKKYQRKRKRIQSMETMERGIS